MDNATLTKHVEAIWASKRSYCDFDGCRDCRKGREQEMQAILTALRAAVDEAKLDGVKAGLEAAAQVAFEAGQQNVRDYQQAQSNGSMEAMARIAERMNASNALQQGIISLDPTTISATVGDA